MNDFSGSPGLAFDAQTIHWEDHPVFRAVSAGNLKTLQKMVDLDVVPPKFGRERSNFIRNELGVTPLMLALTKSRVLPRDTVQKIVTLLLERFKMDPNAADYHGRTAIFYAILHNVDVSVLGTLLNRGADVKALDHDQLSPLMYAAALNRKDIVRFVS
jgi:ankyrin repeat protein